MLFFPRARFVFLTAPIFFLIPQSFVCFLGPLPGFVTLSPCQHPGWQSLHLIDLKYNFSHLLTSLLVNGSWYGSIVPINDFLYLYQGVGTGVTSRCIFGILEKKTSGLYNF